MTYVDQRGVQYADDYIEDPCTVCDKPRGECITAIVGTVFVKREGD
jgi:hypothetical protein